LYNFRNKNLTGAGKKIKEKSIVLKEEESIMTIIDIDEKKTWHFL